MIELSRFTLDNGLRVVHHQDTTTARVAINVLYNVGSRDEDPELTGLAHLFEHLMFGGSVNIPDFDGAIEAAGGFNNAWTSSDYTNFYDAAPAANVETLFWLESDRMLGLAFSEESLEVQRKVVMEEFKQVCLNSPFGKSGHYLRSLLYKQHPYGWPTIGKQLEHIERVTMQDVKDFFYSHYAPNNAVLSVSGNVGLEETRRLAEKWFGPIPRRDIRQRIYKPEPLIEEPRSLVVEEQVPYPMLTIAYPMAAFDTEEYRVADVITDILASGNSSRFYQRLVSKMDLFNTADASVSGLEEPGFMMLSAALADNSDEAIAEAERLLVAEASRLKDELVSAAELERLMNRFESQRTFTQIHFLEKALTLSMAEMQGVDVNTIVDRYRSITPQQIRDVARQVLDPKRACRLIVKPNNTLDI